MFCRDSTASPQQEDYEQALNLFKVMKKEISWMTCTKRQLLD